MLLLQTNVEEINNEWGKKLLINQSKFYIHKMLHDDKRQICAGKKSSNSFLTQMPV
jgi:hypothetical protein